MRGYAPPWICQGGGGEFSSNWVLKDAPCLGFNFVLHFYDFHVFEQLVFQISRQIFKCNSWFFRRYFFLAHIFIYLIYTKYLNELEKKITKICFINCPVSKKTLELVQLRFENDYPKRPHIFILKMIPLPRHKPKQHYIPHFKNCKNC